MISRLGSSNIISAGKLNRQCDIVGRPKSSGLACDDTVSLLSRWLAACQERHPSCRETLSGAIVDEQSAPSLPTRVLQVDEESVRLIEPNGERGRYVTLSYCWGAPEKKPPLVTTRDTMVQNQHEIDFASLPKTYQDAITVVRRMGFRYLWIDSLCIVQDDREDWLRESKKMGAIYERADFTIAPSHAADSWQGFLYSRPMKSTPVELPGFIGSDDGPGVRIFAKIRDEAASDVFPEGGALSNRAWATQEWLLSRRVVFFTPAGIMWSCKYVTQRETGERCFTVARNTHWKSVAEGFSDRRLTYPEDKLVALEGLRAEWGKRTEYSYVSGVWKECLPDQLLWHVCQQSTVEVTDPLALPTWTWMHVPCGVRFLPINGAKNVCKTIEFSDDDSTIIIASKFKAIHTTLGPIDANRDGDNISKAISRDLEGLHGLQDKQAWSLVTYIQEREAISGFVIYDRKRFAGDDVPHFALSLMSTVSPKDDAKEQRTGNPVSTKLREQWVVVVRKAGKDLFERIGAGKIYGNQPWERIMVDDITLI